MVGATAPPRSGTKGTDAAGGGGSVSSFGSGLLPSSLSHIPTTTTRIWSSELGWTVAAPHSHGRVGVAQQRKGDEGWDGPRFGSEFLPDWVLGIESGNQLHSWFLGIVEYRVFIFYLDTLRDIKYISFFTFCRQF